MSGENEVFLDFIPVIRSHPVILVSFQHSESIGFASNEVGMRSDFRLNLTTFPKGKLLSTHAFSSLLLIFCKIEYLHPAQVKVSHEAILPEKENLVQFFRRETGAMVSGE